MGIVSIPNFIHSTELGLWHITETREALLNQLDLSARELVLFASKRTENKKKEWLACRNLLQFMYPKAGEIIYDVHGKPYFLNSDQHISISHSGDYACIYLCKSQPVGVDIQIIKPSISAGYDYFINDSELLWTNLESNVEMHLIWSAKESVFKRMGIYDLNFKTDIKLAPFKSNQNDLIEVTVYNQNITTTIHVRFTWFEGYVLTWTI